MTWSAQNGTDYEVWISRLDGTRLQALDSFVALSYGKVANNIGAFALILPDLYDVSLFDKDRLISIWRKPSGGAQYLEFRGPVLQMFEREEANGNYQLTLYGASLTHLLKRRIIAYAAQTAYTDKTDQIDDMMKAIVRENLGSLVTDAERNMTADGLTVQANLALGPTVSRAFSYKNVLDALRDLSEAARTDGTEVFFSIDPVTDTSFQFNTTITQPGADLRGRFTFSREFGNLGWAQYDQNWSDFADLIYVMGTGDGLSREIIIAYLAATEPSGFHRTEASKDARNDGLSQMLLAAGAAQAQELRAIKHFQGEALSIPGSIYGLDWHFGDYVNASFRGRQFECIIRAVDVTLDQDNKETISALLESYT